MKTSDTLKAMWLKKLKELRANGYDPYDSLCGLKLDAISISWSR